MFWWIVLLIVLSCLILGRGKCDPSTNLLLPVTVVMTDTSTAIAPPSTHTIQHESSEKLEFDETVVMIDCGFCRTEIMDLSTLPPQCHHCNEFYHPSCLTPKEYRRWLRKGSSGYRCGMCRDSPGIPPRHIIKPTARAISPQDQFRHPPPLARLIDRLEANMAMLRTSPPPSPPLPSYSDKNNDSCAIPPMMAPHFKTVYVVRQAAPFRF